MSGTNYSSAAPGQASSQPTSPPPLLGAPPLHGPTSQTAVSTPAQPLPTSFGDGERPGQTEPPQRQPKTPVWVWIAIGVLAVASAVLAGLYLTRDSTTSSSDTSPASSGASSTPSNSQQASPRNNENGNNENGAVPALPTAQREGWVPSGTYEVPGELAPGTYRIGRDYMLYDAGQDSSRDHSFTSEGPTLILIPDDFTGTIEITGGAWPLEASGPVDPFQFTDGTYLVGFDIEPGTYRVSPSKRSGDMAYAARFDKRHEVIENDLISETTDDTSVTIEIRPTDFSFQFTGILERLD